MFSQRFYDAFALAAQLHANQKRKGSDIPYIAHLMAVASIVLEHGGTEDEVIAAFLHDAIEDQGGCDARNEIRKRFGDNVVEIVDGCSDTDITPKPPWLQRKETYIEHLRDASPSVRLVSAADKLHNARSTLNDYFTYGEAIWTRFKGGRQGILWYFRALVEVYQSFDSTPLIQELAHVVGELENAANSNNQPSGQD